VAAFVAAFLGGSLAILAPCSALLLPAFFAYAFANRTALARGTGLFFLGLCTILVPLAFAASLVGRVLIEHRQAAVVVAGLLLIGLGALEALGGGFRWLPARWASRGSATYATGLMYGMTNFCSGPLLGSVLTLAAFGGSWLVAILLLLVYAVGMVVPLFVLAALWDRYDLGHRAVLRGRAFRLGPMTLHSTNLLAGGIFVLLGASFIASQGGALLSGIYDDAGLSALGFRLQDWVASTF
jgi:cytochrome c biogenesis protein CcdA